MHVNRALSHDKNKDLIKRLALIGSNPASISRVMNKEEHIAEESKNAPSVTFEIDFDNIIDLQSSEINKERVAFARSIHSQSGYLEKNKDKHRILIGRGPCRLHENRINKVGGIFLFNDVVMISECLKRNLRYINELVFKFQDGFQVTKINNRLIFKDNSRSPHISVLFDEESTADIWMDYILMMKRTRQALCVFNSLCA